MITNCVWDNHTDVLKKYQGQPVDNFRSGKTFRGTFALSCGGRIRPRQISPEDWRTKHHAEYFHFHLPAVVEIQVTICLWSPRKALPSLLKIGVQVWVF
jgi:hypothetical protein